MVNQENSEGFAPQPNSGRGEPIQLLYANGVTVRLTFADIHITVSVNGMPAMVIAMPLATAKSLSTTLQFALGEYEKKTGIEIKDIEALSQFFKK